MVLLGNLKLNFPIKGGRLPKTQIINLEILQITQLFY